jgi:F-type H+-transporting ATPase subunit delta
MAMTSGSRALARRYARALLETALADAGGVATAASVRLGLDETRGVLAGNAELRRALGHPAVTTEARTKLLGAVFAAAPVLVRRLLELLVVRDRLSLLPAIEEMYAEAWNEQRGAVSAEGVTAVPLDHDQEQALQAALGKVVNRDVELRCRVDPSVLGGVRVRISGRTFDGTARAQLETLRRTLEGA